jgi:hypothetical protein
MRSVCSHVREEPGSKERADRLVKLLAAGLERFLRRQGTGEGSGQEPVDFGPNLSVTTDGEFNGHGEEH